MPTSADGKDPLRIMAAATEQVMHKRGWDESPELLHVFQRDDGRMLGAVADGFFPDGADVHAHLRRAAVWLNSREPQRSVRYRHWQGLMLVCEAWVAPPGTPEGETRCPADIPGGYEVRLVYAADRRGRVYGVQRRRGCEPEVYERVTGDLSQAVLELAQAYAQWWGPDAQA